MMLKCCFMMLNHVLLHFSCQNQCIIFAENNKHAERWKFVQLSLLYYSSTYNKHLAQEGFSDYLKRLKEEKQIEAKKSVLFTRQILGITNSQIGFPKKALIYTKTAQFIQVHDFDMNT